MEWIHRSPQLHSTFGSLGTLHGDGYHINENCNAALETILKNILTEDKYLRTFRRSISFGQNIPKDIIPLLINTKNDNTIELVIEILVNLTIPIECLLSVDALSKTDFGRHTIFEINNLLSASKDSFTDPRVTKVIIEFLKKNIDFEQTVELTPEQCKNIGKGLLLLRNILHIPEEAVGTPVNHTVQNQIIWHIFSQSIDKILIKLMTIPEATHWSVTMVQLIALLYKDQHAVTLHKLLNLWMETTLSETSEDNESNTSPPDRDCEDSSPMLTSDPTSDSSDNGAAARKRNETPKTEDKNWIVPSPMKQYPESLTQVQPHSGDTVALPPPPPPPSLLPPPPLPPAPPPAQPNQDSAEKTMQTTEVSLKRKHEDSKASSGYEDCQSEASSQAQFSCEEKSVVAPSDIGYGTQAEKQESVSTSSNEDEPKKKPVHQKPQHPLQKPNTKIRIGACQQDRKRKKIVKRARVIAPINVHGLSRKNPTDDDISNILKEFTVDFLLKGYNSLVTTLYSQILTNVQLEIDTSHFFWLVTYFLKFASQIELDLEHISSVLSFDIVVYLTAEGVNLCEQFEMSVKLDGSDLKPNMRRLHLVVTAIRELIQSIETYKRLSLFSSENTDALTQLQIKVCEMEELKSLMVLLLRHYNPDYHNKQYLQDLIVTNHILLLFADNTLKMPDYKGNTNIVDHIQQFATPEIMYQYGLLLEDYAENGEFVNDCIFTLMHHIGGELGTLIALFQPSILKTFTSIWKSEFEICDDWSDLIEYVINTFIKKPHMLISCLDTDSLEDEDLFDKQISVVNNKADSHDSEVNRGIHPNNVSSNTPNDRWTESELLSLSWNYINCKTSKDVVGDIVRLLNEDGTTKTRDSVIRELYRQNMITKENHDSWLKCETDRNSRFSGHQPKETREDEIKKLCDQLIKDEKIKFLKWLQKVLLDTCLAKIYLEKMTSNAAIDSMRSAGEKKIMNFEVFKKKQNDMPLLSAVAYISLLLDKSVPLVTWNSEQVTICKDLKFLQLLHRLGFHMPVDTGKLFIRIPHFWSADFLYEMAGRILPIDTSTKDINKNDLDLIATSDNFYQVQEQNHLATMVNFTPKPDIAFEAASGAGPVEEPSSSCWFDIVQRSQELKLRLSAQMPCGEAGSSAWSPPVVTTTTPSGVLAPVMSVAQVPSMPAPARPSMCCDDDDNNSECNTASVASNLTRMYVSEEDEKSEVAMDQTPPDACYTRGKRTRDMITHTILLSHQVTNS